jgi:hypothetical protein
MPDSKWNISDDSGRYRTGWDGPERTFDPLVESSNLSEPTNPPNRTWSHHKFSSRPKRLRFATKGLTDWNMTTINDTDDDAGWMTAEVESNEDER